MDTREDIFEYAVSQSVDGTLADHDRAGLGDRLRSPEGVVLAEKHDRVNRLLRSHDPLPPVDFDAFASSFSDALAREEHYGPAPVRLPTRPPWARRLAAAAAVVLVATAAWSVWTRPTHRPAVAVDVKVSGPVETVPNASPLTQIAVGPTDALVVRGLASGLDAKAEPDRVRAQVVISSVNTGSDLKPF